MSGKRVVVAVLAFALGAGTLAGCEDCTIPGPSSCCKVCKDSKPCGDSCIARSQTCHQSGGCACSGAVGEQ